MTSGTGPQAVDDVVALLRAGAHTVPGARFDERVVLARSRRALRRRRRWQAVVGAAAAGLFALTLASPVHLPGVGTVTMPGGHQLRSVLGLQIPDGPAPVPGINVDELVAHVGSQPPTPAKMAQEVTSLQTHVLPVLEELQATWYEVGACDILQYQRGTFSADGTCGGRPGEQRFDSVARADLDRLLAAVVRSGVPTEELLSARYARDGRLVDAGLLRTGGGIEWNYAYLYSPDERPRAWTSPLGPVTITEVGTTGWWFEKSPND